MAQQILQLEAFEASPRNHRIQWYIHKDAPCGLPSEFANVVLSDTPQFVRKILILAEATPEAWKLSANYSLIFKPQTAQDWGLLITMIANSPQPTLVLSAPELRIPLAFFQKCPKVTFVQFSYLSDTASQMTILPSAVFFPYIQNLDDPNLDTIQKYLPLYFPPEMVRTFSLRDALHDMRGSGACLAISTIDEPKNQGSLCWYYANPQNKEKNIISDVIQTLLFRQ